MFFTQNPLIHQSITPFIQLNPGAIMKNIILAFQFLTILPLPNVTAESKHFGRLMIYFPLVGLFLGGVLFGFHLAVSSFPERFPSELEPLFMLILLVVLTRGLHLEGFADFLDGFLGGRDHASILRIMKDSRSGAFAVVGVVFLILGKFIFLQRIVESGDPPWILCVFPCVSRWSAVLFCFRARDPRPEGGLANTFTEALGLSHLLLATSVAFAISFYFLGKVAAGYFVLAGALSFCLRLLSHKKIGGITGDVIGANVELTEFGILFLGVFAI